MRAWSATSLVNEDGQRLSAPTSGSLQDPPTLTAMDRLLPQPVQQADHRCRSGGDRFFRRGGQDALTQLADYTAMRALAKTRPVGKRNHRGGYDPGPVRSRCCCDALVS